MSGGLSCDGVAQQWSALPPRYKLSPRSLIWKPDFSAEHHERRHLSLGFELLGWNHLEETAEPQCLAGERPFPPAV